MTRNDLINLIRETETRMTFAPTKGLRRLVKAELVTVWANLLASVESEAHMDHAYITQVDATLASQVVPMDIVSQADMDAVLAAPDSYILAEVTDTTDALTILDMADDARIRGDFPTAFALDNLAEDRGAHADGRTTCYRCRSWANHAHDVWTGAKVYEWPQVDVDQAWGITSRVYPLETVVV